MHLLSGPQQDQIRKQIHEQMRILFNIEDTQGIELFVMLQSVAHLSRLLDNQRGAQMELSVPRWRLLLRLLVEEHLGNAAGLTPTELSQSQQVSKNTISALLRGLETQGLIQRSLDSNDLRAFRIHLTRAGRDHLRSLAPGRIQAVSRLSSGLNPEEQEQLTTLLEKMQCSLLKEYQSAGAADETLLTEDQPVPLNQE